MQIEVILPTYLPSVHCNISTIACYKIMQIISG